MEILNKDMGPAEVGRILRRCQFMTNREVVRWVREPGTRPYYLTRYKAIIREMNRQIDRFDAFVDLTGAYATLEAVVIDGETYERGEVFRVVETLMAEAQVIDRDRRAARSSWSERFQRDERMPTRRWDFPSYDQLAASEMRRNFAGKDGTNVNVRFPQLGIQALVGPRRELLWVSMKDPEENIDDSLGGTGRLMRGPLFETVQLLLVNRGIVSRRTTEKSLADAPVEGSVMRVGIFDSNDVTLTINGQPITAPVSMIANPPEYRIGQTYYDSEGNPFGTITSVDYERGFGIPDRVRLTVLMANGQVARVDEGPEGGFVTVTTPNTDPFMNVSENLRRMGMSSRETSDTLGVIGRALSPESDQFDALRRVMSEIDPNGSMGPAQAMNKAVREKIQRILEDPDPKCEAQLTVTGECSVKFCHVHSDTARGRIWISEDKKRTMVKDLKDDHLFNIVQYLEREGRTKGIYPIMRAEFIRRALGKPRDDGLVRRPNPFFLPPE